jgi:hypothetical protein
MFSTSGIRLLVGGSEPHLGLDSISDRQPRDSQRFEQVRIVSSHFPRVWLMNGEPFRHGPVLENCPVLNRVAVAGVVVDSRASELECNPAGLLCQ